MFIGFQMASFEVLVNLFPYFIRVLFLYYIQKQLQILWMMILSPQCFVSFYLFLAYRQSRSKLTLMSSKIERIAAWVRLSESQSIFGSLYFQGTALEDFSRKPSAFTKTPSLWWALKFLSFQSLNHCFLLSFSASLMKFRDCNIFRGKA